MSAPTAAEEEAQLIAIAAALAPSNYIVVAISALLVYEWVIGFGKEINLFWKEKVTAATVMFLLNRYAPLVYFLSSFAGNSAYTDKSCNAAVLSSIALDIFQYFPWALFSALRTYALCGKRWGVAIPVLILSSVPIGINLTRFFWSHGEMIPIWGCDTITVVPANINLIFSILPRSSLIVADAIVAIVTWMTTYSSAATGGFSHQNIPSIAQRLLINGTIYFVILAILNLLHLIFTLRSIAVQDHVGDDTSYVIAFTEPITAILVSRFMFDLQKAKQRSQHRSDFSDAAVTGFDRALGSISSTLSTTDVWRAELTGPAASDPDSAEGRPSSDPEDEEVFMKLEPDVFGKRVMTWVDTRAGVHGCGEVAFRRGCE